jgi:hypothetical protein
MARAIGPALAGLLVLAGAPVGADPDRAEASPARPSAPDPLGTDPHYTPVGFFDVHVCNWPGEPLFFLVLFATEHFAEVLEVEVRGPDGGLLARLDGEGARRVARAGRPEKRVYIRHVPVGPAAPDGWYTATTRLRDGGRVTARDYVIVTALARATGLHPGAEEPPVPLPAQLTWQPVPGARFYQVAIRDRWEGERLVHESPLLAEPGYRVPAGVLQAGGRYAWKVHARDLNGHVLLGDFNHGSQSEWVALALEEAP